jgi:catechol 2,3-dioxygenase-like lactoylglutathione lyase family enzyme
MAKLKNINVVFLYVADIERARKFYEEKIGFGEPIQAGPSWVEYALEGGTHFALHKAASEPLQPVHPGQNTVKFSIVVEDLKGAFKELSAKGVTFTRPPEKGFGFDLVEFEDPDGNQVRLIQFTTTL